MRKNFLRTNKYTLSVISILLLLLITDIIVHKGMVRVLLPAPNLPGRAPAILQPTKLPFFSKGKKWKKGINTLRQMEQLDENASGFEVDVYFDPQKNVLQVYHDSARITTLELTALLNIYAAKKLNASLWLDFKNLSPGNLNQSLAHIDALREKYGLQNKVIVESSQPQLLSAFANRGIFTSYYVRNFNPYLVSKHDLREELEHIRVGLSEAGICALSGYYFQYPALKKYFPRFPILTWSDKPGFSVVASLFNEKLLTDRHVAAVLYP